MAKSEYWDDVAKEEICWLRWDPLPEFTQPAQGDVVSTDFENLGEPLQRVVGLEDSPEHGYATNYELGTDEPEDELESLTEVMVGKGEDGLVEVVPDPPVNPKEIKDHLGIRKFIGRSKKPKSQSIIREDND